MKAWNESRTRDCSEEARRRRITLEGGGGGREGEEGEGGEEIKPSEELNGIVARKRGKIWGEIKTLTLALKFLNNYWSVMMIKLSTPYSAHMRPEY